LRDWVDDVRVTCLFDRTNDPLINRLKVLRAERGWSQAQLAEHLDVSRQAVNAVETGKYDPSLPLAFRIARLFGLPIEEIFDDGHSKDR
jgi:putative transcriptional regulator